MNIFFLASIHGKSEHQDKYHKIVELVERHGHVVVADHILDAAVQSAEQWSDEESITYHTTVFEHIKAADAVLVEASYNSTSVGYLTAIAVTTGKPVAIFYSGTQEPAILKTLEHLNEKMVIVRYANSEELAQEVPMTLEYITSLQDIRFNFFVSPEISSYLDWVAKSRKVPRSVYLRQLIDADMKNMRDYEQA